MPSTIELNPNLASASPTLCRDCSREARLWPDGDWSTSIHSSRTPPKTAMASTDMSALQRLSHSDALVFAVLLWRIVRCASRRRGCSNVDGYSSEDPTSDHSRLRPVHKLDTSHPRLCASGSTGYSATRVSREDARGPAKAGRHVLNEAK